jgi:hypothetical protein
MTVRSADFKSAASAYSATAPDDLIVTDARETSSFFSREKSRESWHILCTLLCVIFLAGPTGVQHPGGSVETDPLNLGHNPVYLRGFLAGLDPGPLVPAALSG